MTKRVLIGAIVGLVAIGSWHGGPTRALQDDEGGPVRVEPSIDVEYDLVRAYDVFGGQSTVTEFTVVTERPPDLADHFLEIEASAGGVLGFEADGFVLAVDLRSPSDGTSERGTVLRVALPPPEAEAAVPAPSRTLVRLFAQAGQVVPPGLYEALLDIRLTDGAQVSAELVAVPVPLDVPGRAEVVIAGGSGSFDPTRSVSFIDFGELETGERRDLFATIRSNTQTRVTVSSVNSGMLLQPDRSDLPGVPYSVVFDGAESDLAAPLVLSRSPVPTRAGTSYPFSVIIGLVGAAPAGEYVDEVTIEVSPQ